MQTESAWYDQKAFSRVLFMHHNGNVDVFWGGKDGGVVAGREREELCERPRRTMSGMGECGGGSVKGWVDRWVAVYNVAVLGKAHHFWPERFLWNEE